MTFQHLLLFLVNLCLIGGPIPLLAEKPPRKAEATPVEARLIVKQSEYFLPKAHHGKSFCQRIEEETDSDKLPDAPKVNLVLELKNISKVDVMIWPEGAVTYPDLTVKGAGVVQPANLQSISGESTGSSIQPTIAQGKSYLLSIESLNPNGGTPWYYWSEPGEYTITATYTVYTGLPPFPFPDKTKPKGKPKKLIVTTPPIKVKVILEGKKD